MKLLKRTLLILGGLVALLAIAGLFLPTTAHVERSIVTSASPERVYSLVDGFSRFNEWSPWSELDPDTKYAYSGPASGVGARMEWASEDSSVGSGSQQIVAVDPRRSVSTALDFGAQGKAGARIDIAAADSGSRITWSMDANFAGDYLGRYFGLFLDGMVGKDYDKGLARLKALAESGR